MHADAVAWYLAALNRGDDRLLVDSQQLSRFSLGQHTPSRTASRHWCVARNRHLRRPSAPGVAAWRRRRGRRSRHRCRRGLCGGNMRGRWRRRGGRVGKCGAAGSEGQRYEDSTNDADDPQFQREGRAGDDDGYQDQQDQSGTDWQPR